MQRVALEVAKRQRETIYLFQLYLLQEVVSLHPH
jgi:hypothetical protein